MEDDLITVIVPIYNAEKNLKSCINSIVNQTYKAIEIILINDGSTDNSKKICEDFQKEDKRIVLVNNDNRGVSYTRNTGIKLAKGKYITFIDADDWIEKNYIETMHKEIIKNKINAVRCSYYINLKNEEKNCNENIDYLDINKKNNNNDLIIKAINNDFGSYVWLLMVETKFLRESNIYFDESMGYMEDVKFYVDILLADGKIHFINDRLYHYRVENNSVSHSFTVNQIKKNFNSIINVLNNIEIKYKDKFKLEDSKKIEIIIDTRLDNEIDGAICKIFYNDKKHYYEVLNAITELLNENRKRNIAFEF